MKKINLRSIVLSLAIFAMMLTPGLTLAQGGLQRGVTNLDTVVGQAGIDKDQSIEEIVGGLIKTALSLIGVIFLILMVYSGFIWMTARGQEDRVKKAQDTIRAALIGLVVVVAAYAITAFVVARLSGIA